MKVVRGICPACHKYKMNVLLLTDNKVKCPRCGATSSATKWYNNTSPFVGGTK